jgi:DNA-binding beta-propeller fold protein YncE
MPRSSTKRTTAAALAALCILPACGSDDETSAGGSATADAGTGGTGTGAGGEAALAGPWRGAVADNLALGASDNAEVVKTLPAGDFAVLAASKARKVALLAVTADGLVARRERILFPEDPGEGELTHIDFMPDGQIAAVTRTMPVVDASGTQTDCQGALVFVKIEDTEAFGETVVEVPVGPMPDAVDISPDGRWAVVANERDAVTLYGKCAVETLSPSISVLDLSAFPTVTEAARIELDGGVGQEPEQVIFSADSDHVAVVLQDSQQVAVFTLSALLAQAAPTAADLNIVTLPNNSLDAEPWPDGAAAFTDAGGRSLYAIAGEYNDTITLLDTSGAVVKVIEVDASLIPAEIPRGAEDAPPFRPDSLTAFVTGGKAHVAASLKNAGAVGVWDVSNPDAPVFLQAIKVGENETAGPTEESVIGTEGISASKDGAVIVTANEGESSASLIRRE